MEYMELVEMDFLVGYRIQSIGLPLQVDLVVQQLAGGPTLEQFWASYNAVYGTGYTSEKEDLSSHIGYSNTLYFPHTSIWDSTNAYWLTTATTAGIHLMYVNYNGLIFHCSYNVKHRSVRPLVCLPSNAKADWNGTAWELSN